MLTVATTLISLGTDLASVRPASPERTDCAGISFAKSFDEGSALAGEMQSQIADVKKLKGVVGTETVVFEKNSGVVAGSVGTKAKAGASAGDKIENELISEKTLNPATNVKASGVIANGLNVTARRALQHSDKSNGGASTVIQAKVPEGQISAGGTKNLTQNSELGEDVDVANGTASLQPDVAVPIAPPAPGDGVKAVIEKQDGMLVSDSSQETDPIKKAAKEHDGIVKQEKAAKTEKKMEKTPDKTDTAVGTETRSVATVPIIVLPGDGQQHGSGATAEDAPLASGVSPNAMRDSGIIAVADSKADKKPVSTGKSDRDNVKASVPLVADNTASRKGEIDTAKAGLPAAKATESDNAKTQGAVTPTAAASGPVHPEWGPSDGAFAGAVGHSAALHIVSASSHAAEISSHATISPQAGSGAMDAVVPMDMAHKTLAATPTSLEVGVANGSHGWLKVRAEMAGGGVVNASLSSASSSGQEMLHRELPSLTAYLQSERVAVNAVVVQPTVANGIDPRGFDGGMNGDGRGQAQQSDGQGGESRHDRASAVLNRVEENGLYNRLGGTGGNELLPPSIYARGGSWLSVRA